MASQASDSNPGPEVGNTSLVRQALWRGLVHASVGTSIALALLFGPFLAILVGLAIATGLYLLVDATRLRVPFLNFLFQYMVWPFMRPRETGELTGSSYYLVACLVAALVFPVEYAAAGILFLAWGDSSATVVGVWKGETRLGGQSLEGHLACLAACLLIGYLLTLSGYVALLLVIPGAVAATVFEALPSYLNDNLTITLGSAGMMTFLSNPVIF